MYVFLDAQKVVEQAGSGSELRSGSVIAVRWAPGLPAEVTVPPPVTLQDFVSERFGCRTIRRRRRPQVAPPPEQVSLHSRLVAAREAAAGSRKSRR